MKSFHKLQHESIKLKKYSKVEPCVYFLIDKNEIVYVGSSINLSIRLPGHATKKYDEIYYTSVSTENSKEVEKSYIEKFNPKYNISGNDEYDSTLIEKTISPETSPKTMLINCVVLEDDHKKLIELMPRHTDALNFSHWLRLAEKREINKIERKINSETNT